MLCFRTTDLGKMNLMVYQANVKGPFPAVWIIQNVFGYNMLDAVWWCTYNLYTNSLAKMRKLG